MTQLLLIRHGQSVWNAEKRIQGRADPPLSDAGREQARKLAQRLAKEQDITAIYSSPLARARQTADEIGLALDLPVQIDERLSENDVGQFTGLTGPEIAQQFPDWFAKRQASQEWIQIPGGESRGNFRERVVAAMTLIVAHHPEQTITIVSHGGTLNIYLAHLLNMPLYLMPPFQFDNASLSIIHIGPARMRVLRLNDTVHLTDGNEDNK